MNQIQEFDLDDICFSNRIGVWEKGETYLINLKKYSMECAVKIIHINNANEMSIFFKYAHTLQRYSFNGLIPFIGLSRKQERYILIFKYANNLSLKHIFDLCEKGKPTILLDKAKQLQIIYEIAQTMNFLHQNKILHGKLTPSNILFNENYSPQISDFNFPFNNYLSKCTPEFLIKNDLFYYVDPLDLNTGKISTQSDVFAFSIISLQILSCSAHIYKEEKEPCNPMHLIQKIIQGKAKPIIPIDVPSELKNLLLSCFNENQDERPNFQQICEALEPILISHKISPKYKNKIQLTAKEKIPKKLQLNTTTNTEAEKQKVDSKIKNNKINHVLLAEDYFFEEQKCEIDKIINKISSNMIFEEKFKFNKDELQKHNFILTEEAEERLNKLYNYISLGIPVLLEGPTGTAKTLSSEIVCEALNLDMIRFNLSSETRIQDLIGRYVGDENSWSGILMKDGPFYEAYRFGKVLILDEINLASEPVLQCIEEALDGKFLCIELPGKPLEKIRKDPKFRLIATQNPNKGLYANKRQNLGLKFYSRFQVINFPAFTYNELLKIAKGLSIKHNNINVIKELVSFHQKWSEYAEKINDPQCFTIREIAATVNSISNGKNIYDTIMTIYGARYRQEMKNILEEELNNFPNLKKDEKDSKDEDIMNILPDCFPNDSLKSAVKSILFSLRNGRNVILTGDDGCGKTQIAIWISQYDYDNNIPKEEEESYFCACSDEIKVSDLIGHQVPSSTSDGINKIIEWQDGFLLKAVRTGKIAVMDNIEEAPSTVKERLNSLLDQKYNTETKYFNIPESPNNQLIEINKKFRIIATCDFDKLTQMSPAFLNRFDIIVLENQINDSTDFNSLIFSLLNRYYSENHCDNIEYNDSEEMSDSLEVLEDLDEEVESESIFGRSFRNSICSKEIISKIIEKLKNEKTFSYISRFCKAFIKFKLLFQNDPHINNDDIIEFVYILLNNKTEMQFPELIEQKILQMLDEDNSENIQDDSKNNKDDFDNNEPFYYHNLKSISTLLVKLMAYSLIEQHVVITGETGVGKTSAARVFSLKKKSKIQIHSFHSGTRTSHIFGTTTIRNGKIEFQYGPLTNALIKGSIFIADEFNLATHSAMKSLALALDPTIPRDIYIPNLNEFKKIKQGFQFIACQNELETKGRNDIPHSIAKRLIFLKYPDPSDDEIKEICVRIAEEILIQKGLSFQQSDKILAEQIGSYMYNLNNKKLPFIQKWSFRDITKVFKRIFSIKDNLDLINIEPLHVILFYTMSLVPPSESKRIIEEIKGIFQNSFQCVNVDDILKVFLAKPKIKKIEGKRNGIFIFKKKCGVSSFLEENDISQQLPSLYNVYFQIRLSDESEHILLMGNSGFKTYISKLFLKDAQTIYLNQESNIPQLLGKTCLMGKYEAKLFYIDNILKILKEESLKVSFRNFLKLETLSREKIDDLIQKTEYPKIFKHVLINLTNKLFEENANDSNSFISNMVLEFHPGLFFDALLKRKTLILKDISNLNTMVLERFNELFSGRQNLTLSEDITNTFTDENKKELTNFRGMFRVFATCSLIAQDKLSDAVFSRFTTIYAPEYTREELTIVLQNYSQKNENFDQKAIPQLLLFADSFNLNNMTFSFPQILKTIEITSKMNKMTSIEDQPKNIGIAIYRIIGGLLSSHNLKNKLFKKLKNTFDIPDIYQNKEMRPFIITEKGIDSIMTNLTVPCFSIRISKKVAFTSLFNDLLDLIHMGLAIHNPIILEGNSGQGKHTAIHYIADMLNIEIIEIIISQSTKVEDLFGKEIITQKDNIINVETVETQFIQAIKSTNICKKQLIVLENINNASPAVLNALIPVFNTNTSEILLPNGSTIIKGVFDIIAIFNSQNLSSIKEKLPLSLINSSLYHILPKFYKNEIEYIIKTNFSLAGLKDEASYFYKIYSQANDALINNGNITDLYSLNDIQKYILLRALTKHCFHETTIMKMIFAYKFSKDEILQKILNSLNFEKMKFNPIFSYDGSKKYLNVRISKDSNDHLSIPIETANDKYLSKITSLTLPQKHCLIFLMCTVLIKRASIIKGETASGKSSLIRLFANLVGKNLIVFQVNSESNLSMLAQQSVLKDSISDDDIISLYSAFSYLYKIEELELNTIDKIDINDSKKCNPKILKDLIISIENKLPLIKDKTNHSNALNAIQDIKKIMNPIHLFNQQKSMFINALTNGDWVLIDGLESAPSATREKIASLCGENPKLNLYEYGPDFHFSYNANSSENKISDHFHLFITYNQNSTRNELIDQEFLTKGFTFSLPPIDENIEYSSQLLFGFLEKQFSSIDLAKELACRLANMHSYAKSISSEKPEDFAGGIHYNGRTLAFMEKKFKFNKKNFYYTQSKEINIEIAKQICFSLQFFYCNSYIKQNFDKLFYENCINAFKQVPEKALIDQLNESDINNYMHYNNIKKRNKPILIQLRKIQLQTRANQECILSFHQFFENCSLIRFSDLKYIDNHINDTLSIISSTIKSKPDFKINHNNKLSAIYSIHLRFKSLLSFEIPKEYSCLTINNFELKSNLNISLDLLKIDLLKELNESNLFSKETSIILINEIYLQAISIISEITSNISKQSIINLFKYINQTPNHICVIDDIFPYQKYKNSNLQMISTWLPIARNLIEKNFHSIFIFGDESFEFNESSQLDFILKLVFNEEDSLLCSIETEIIYLKNAKPFKIISKSETEDKNKINFVFEYIVSQIVKNPNQSNSKDKLNSYFKNGCKRYGKNSNNLININKVLKLKDLFTNSDCPFVCLLWNVLYTLNESDVINLTKIIDPIESKFLYSVLMMIKSLNKDLIDCIVKWSKWASNYDDYSSILYKIFNKNNDEINFSLNNIEKLIRDVEQTKMYFDNSPILMRNYWPCDEFIHNCQKKYDELIKIKNKNTLTEEQNEIQQKIDNLKIQIRNVNVIKTSNNELKEKIISSLSSIPKEDLTKSKYEYIFQFVNQFLEVSFNEKEQLNETCIKWPYETYIYSELDANFENKNLLESLIWYSKIRSILNELKNSKNIISNLLKLADFKEVVYIRDIILNCIFDSKNKSAMITSECMREALNMLNSQMIYKLFIIDKTLITEQEIIWNIINGYIDRNLRKSSEIKWFSEKIHEISSDFKIYMPEFEPYSLVLLIINQNSSTRYQFGQLFEDFDNDCFLQNASSLLNEKFKTFSDVVEKVATIAYDVILPNYDPPEDYDMLKNTFLNQAKTNNSNYQIISKINILFDLAERLDKRHKKQLKFDDVEFLTTNLFENNDFAQKYPSLFFWICKNPACANQLRKIYGNYNPVPNEIPFWLLYLRVISSIQCIKFEPQFNSEISKIINEATTSTIINYLYNSTKENQNINFTWINILLHHPPHQLANSNIKMIHNFLVKLSQNDSYDNRANKICVLALQVIKQSVNEITSSIILNLSDKLINDDFSQENISQNFLMHPWKYIAQRIEQKIISIQHLYSKEKLITNLFTFIKENDFQVIKSNLIEAIKEDEIKHQHILIEKVKNEIISQMKEYNSIIQKLEGRQIKNKDIDKNVNKLFDIQNILNEKYPKIFSDELFEIKEFKCIYIQSEINFKYIKNEFIENHCLIDNLLPKSDIFIQSLNNISFGNYNTNEFIKELENYENLLKSFEEKFLNVLKSDKELTNDFLDYIQKVNNSVNIIEKNLELKYEDFLPNETIKTLQNELKEYLVYFHSNFDEVKRIVDNEIEPMCNAIHSNQYIKIKNLNEYDLIVPNQNNYIEIPSLLTEIKRHQSFDSLKSPIICLSSDNKIICSLSQLKCKIRTIFSDFAKKESCQLFIKSLIDTEITIKIENKNEQNNKYIMLANNKLRNKDPIQFLIIPPELTSNNPKTIELKGNLIIEAVDIQAFSLPFEITLELFPLAIKIKCEQFLLINEANKKCFKLCCEKIDTDSSIDFSFENYYFKEKIVIYSIELESLQENDAKKPEIKLNNNNKGFSLLIPHVDKQTRCQFDIIIKFTETFENRIRCDFLIEPFDFTFKIYDYVLQKYVSNTCNIIYTKEKSPFIYCRIRKNTHLQKIGSIFYSLPYFINIDGSVMLRQFIINNDKNDKKYDFHIQVSYIDNGINLRNNNRYYIKLSIENITKNIVLNFINYEDFYPHSNECSNLNNIFIKNFPTYLYNENIQDKWVRIRKDNELNNARNQTWPQILVTPFSYHIINKYRLLGHVDYHYEKNEYVYVNNPDDNLFIDYVQIAIAKDRDDVTRESRQVKTYKINKNRKGIIYYSILGKTSNFDLWFPAFDKYPNINGICLLKYEANKENCMKARSNIKRMINSLMNNPPNNKDFDVHQLDLKNEKPTNFIFFLNLLLQKEVVLGFPSIYSKCPIRLQEKLESIQRDIQRFIDKKNISSKMLSIISHNLIVTFADIFQRKYKEIENHLFYLNLPVLKSEIEKKIYDAYFVELVKYDENKEEIEIEAEYPISINPSPYELNNNEFFIITENSVIKSFEDDINQPIDLSNNDIGEVNYENITYSIKELPSIVIPDKLNIKELNHYYSLCSYGASVFPVYIIYCLQNNIEENDLNDYFSKLLNAYINVVEGNEINKSILSDPINKFINSFESCLNRLKKAGVNFDDKIKSLKKISVDYNSLNYDFILTPKIDKPYIPQIKWRIKSEINDIQEIYSINQFKRSVDYHYEEVPNVSIHNSLSQLFKESSQNLKSKPMIHQTNLDDNNVKNIEIMPFIFNDYEYENQEEDKNSDDKSDNNENKVTKRVISAIKNVNLTPYEFNKVVNKIDTMDNIIKLINQKIKTIDNKSQIEFSDFKFIRIQNHKEIPDIGQDNLPVKLLIEHSQYLIEKLIAAITNSKCPLLTISCNLLIDCSCNISQYNKMFNFMILSSFSYALSALEIPFTISIVADQHLRFILKSFDDELSDFILQQVLDCLFITRYRVNIPDTFYHAINDFEYSDRNQKASFIFTDGLDENLSLTNSWKELILNNKDNSFGMLFIKPDDFDNEKYTPIRKMWDNFIEFSKTSVSTAKLIYIDPNFNDDVINSVITLFVNVLSRLDVQTIKNMNDVVSIKPIFEYKCENLNKEELLSIQKSMSNPLNIKGKMFIKNDNKNILNGVNFGKINHSYYSNKIGKINSSDVDQSIKKDFDLFIHNMLYTNRNSNKPYLEAIFKPNKASQVILSRDGTEIDISALILNLLMRVPDPPIFLVEKGGLIRNYGISIIIDSSQSCFNPFCSAHAYQTLKTLFSSLSTIDISCVDIIIATDDMPVVLYSEIPSLRLFNDKSSFWPTLFSYLSKKITKTCKLENAIHAAYDLIAMRYPNFTSYIFILTDGLYQDDQKESIRKHIFTCIHNDIITLGIGIGIYPKGIIDIFSKAIFSPNPKHLLKGIASFFGGESYGFNSEICESIISTKINQKVVFNVLNSMLQTVKKPLFKELKEDLQNQPVGIDAVSHAYNKETRKETRKESENNQFIYNSGKNKQMYSENIFEGLQILIVMPYDCRMNIKENNIYKEKLLKQEGSDKNNLQSALSYYGIKIHIVHDYQEAIAELTKQTKHGKCDYYAVWVLSGLPYDCPLANGGNQKYVMQFIICLKQFWEKGGSVVLFADGDPLTFQANLFLKTIVFPDGSKTKLRFKGSHKGGEILEPDEKGKLDQPGKFNKSKNIFKKFQRASLSHGLFQIPEGKTISYIEDNGEDLSPFIPFMKDSEGGISVIFYPGDCDLDHRRGDIIVDGGFSKLFNDMNSEETFRYVSNVAAWTTQYESKYLSQKTCSPELFCPDAVYAQINEYDLYTKFKPIPSNLRLKIEVYDSSSFRNRLFVINTNKSVGTVKDYYNTVKSQIDLHTSIDGYAIMSWNKTSEMIPKDRMIKIIKNKETFGSWFFSSDIDISSIPKVIINNRNTFYDANGKFIFEHLILISDEHVNLKSITEAEKIIKENNIKFKYVTAYFVGEHGNLQQFKQIIAPFCRNCGSLIYRVKDYVFPRVISKTCTSDFSSLELIDTINDIEKFNRYYKSLFIATKQKTIGTDGDQTLKRKFENMKERLKESFKNSNEGTKNEYKIEVLIKMASGEIKNIFDSDIIAAIADEDTINE